MVLDFNQMPPNVREIEIAEPEYTDLLNVNAESKKRKLCADAGGSNVRVKKETGDIFLGFRLDFRHVL